MLLIFFNGKQNSKRQFINPPNQNKMSEIYRFKFSVEFSELLNNFAKIHQYDERKDFKEEWKKWCEINNEFIEKERIEHEEKGYNGDILKKIYNSVRYYYRNKSTIKKEPVKRRPYIHIGKDVLQKMDEFIKENESMKPSNGFDMYYNINRTRTRHNSREEEENHKSMLKKTYKNRCYNINNRENAK